MNDFADDQKKETLALEKKFFTIFFHNFFKTGGDERPKKNWWKIIFAQHWIELEKKLMKRVTYLTVGKTVSPSPSLSLSPF